LYSSQPVCQPRPQPHGGVCFRLRSIADLFLLILLSIICPTTSSPHAIKKQEDLGNKTKDRSTSSHVTMSDPKSDSGRTGYQQSRSNLHQSHGIAPPPIKFPSSSTSSVAQTPSRYTDNDFTDVENGERNTSSGERAPLFRTGHHEGEGRPGLPKLSRECLWS
jgi:hypothetical protein